MNAMWARDFKPGDFIIECKVDIEYLPSQMLIKQALVINVTQFPVALHPHDLLKNFDFVSIKGKTHLQPGA